MSYYAKHLFVCTNRRDKPCRQSCGDNNIGANAIDYLKGHAKAMGLVLYPQGRWYTYRSESDLQEILEDELVNDRIVTRLLMDESISSE